VIVCCFRTFENQLGSTRGIQPGECAPAVPLVASVASHPSVLTDTVKLHHLFLSGLRILYHC